MTEINQKQEDISMYSVKGVVPQAEKIDVP